MRYFFRVTDGSNTIEDEEGTVLSGPEAAMMQAQIIAAELAQDGRYYEAYVVCAIDEQGKEVGRMPIVVGGYDD